MRVAVGLVALSLVVGCVQTSEQTPFKTRRESVQAGERTPVLAHGRWSRRGSTCVPKAPHRLELHRGPLHGRVEFATLRLRPSVCAEGFEHAVIVYTSNASYTGVDRFSYFRIHPESGRREILVASVQVRGRRETVGEIQRLLDQFGFAPGPVDGIVGPRTRAAVRAYEKNRGLRVTGEPTSALLRRLESKPRPQPL